MDFTIPYLRIKTPKDKMKSDSLDRSSDSGEQRKLHKPNAYTICTSGFVLQTKNLVMELINIAFLVCRTSFQSTALAASVRHKQCITCVFLQQAEFYKICASLNMYTLKMQQIYSGKKKKRRLLSLDITNVVILHGYIIQIGDI